MTRRASRLAPRESDRALDTACTYPEPEGGRKRFAYRLTALAFELNVIADIPAGRLSLEPTEGASYPVGESYGYTEAPSYTEAREAGCTFLDDPTLGASEAAAVPCPECGEPVWDVAHGSKLNKCWNTAGTEVDDPFDGPGPRMTPRPRFTASRRCLGLRREDYPRWATLTYTDDPEWVRAFGPGNVRRAHGHGSRCTRRPGNDRTRRPWKSTFGQWPNHSYATGMRLSARR
jgi:hypothetical protein